MNLGPYRLLARAGTGPLGEWYRADDTDTDQTVRVLVLWQHRAAAASAQSFAKRLKLIALVHNEFVASLRDLSLESDPPFVAATDLPDSCLADALPDGDCYSEDAILKIGHGVCEALAAAHRIGLVHGRLYPSAIWLTAEGVPVVDFIGGWTATPQDGATLLDGVDGAPPGDPDTAEDAADDVAALGAILYRLVCDHEAPIATPPTAAGGAEAANSLLDLIACMLTADPAERPTAAETLACLGRIADGAEKVQPQFTHEHEQLATQMMPATVQPLPATVITGVRLGRFRLTRKLGEGALGVVYRAEDVTDNRPVAIKVLHAHLLDRPEVLRRFRKEARMLAAVASPFICGVIEFNQDAGRHFLVLEYLEGETLGAILGRYRRLPEFVALTVAAAVARGLADAHRRGVVHRDVKPENIMLVGPWSAWLESERVAGPSIVSADLGIKLCDFGLARHVEQSASMNVTAAGLAVGTPLYMAPEQAVAAARVTAASDVYSLGATLFHALTGRTPFEADGVAALLVMHQSAPVPSPRQYDADLSDGVCAVVQKALAKDAAARYPDAGALLEDFERLLRGEPTSLIVHPRLPTTEPGQVLAYNWSWELTASPEQLWPYVSNTERVNHAIGLPAVTYTHRAQDASAAALPVGVATFGAFRKAGFQNTWQEHPFEWVEGRRMGVLREYSEGVFHWLASITELNRRADGGTTLVHQVRVVPRGLLGWLVAALEVGFKGRRRLEQVYRQMDATLTQGPGADPSADAFVPSGPRRGDDQRVGYVVERLRGCGVDRIVAETLGGYLIRANDQEVARIRPLALAARLGLPADAVVDACLLAAHGGLFVLLWDILCPLCRVPSAIEETLRDIRSHGRCAACNLDFELDFANSVEMIFRPHASLRTSDPGIYCAGGPAHAPHVVAQVRVAASERLELALNLSEGPYRLRGARLPYSVDFRVHPQAHAVRGELELVRGPGSGLPRTFRTGTQTLIVTNDYPEELVIRVERLARRDDALTAARAAAHPRFRELFPFEVLSGNQLVSVAHVTLLATRLDGAAAFYRELGDARAFALVHEHFRVLEAHIRNESGALIKTVNDGLLASFHDPAAAVRVALNLQGLLEAGGSTRALRIRTGVHSGPAMVATLNGKLDYFGTTVHQTMRLCDFTVGGEVTLTQPVVADPHVQVLLNARRLICAVIPDPDAETAAVLPYRIAAASKRALQPS